MSNSYIATFSSTRLSRSLAVLSNTILLKSLYNLLSDPITPTLPKQSRFGLFPVRSPLLRESLLFSFPMGTKMFQFPTSALCSAQWHIFHMPGCPIRRSTDQFVCADTRSFSQLITSFFASESQGIHRLPLSFFALRPFLWSPTIRNDCWVNTKSLIRLVTFAFIFVFHLLPNRTRLYSCCF